MSHTKSILIQVPQPLVPSGLETASSNPLHSLGSLFERPRCGAMAKSRPS